MHSRSTTVEADTLPPLSKVSVYLSFSLSVCLSPLLMSGTCPFLITTPAVEENESGEHNCETPSGASLGGNRVANQDNIVARVTCNVTLEDVLRA